MVSSRLSCVSVYWNAGYGTFMGSESPMLPGDAMSKMPFHNTRRKWLMMGILSALTAINQGICYSYAPIASIVESRWQEHVRPVLLLPYLSIWFC